MAKKHMSINETKSFLQMDIKTWQEDPERDRAVLFIMGETGNGKTQLIQQVGRELSMEMVELNLGNALDPTELTGCRIPVKVGNGYTLKLALLDELRNYVDGKKPWILFIDELGAEQSQMRNFLLKLFAERSLNGVKLDKAYVVCAGNPPGSYKTTPLEPALRARVSIVHTVATSDEVADHFEAKQVKTMKTNKDLAEAYEVVASFLRRNPTSFGGMDGKQQDSENPIRCARAYEYCVSSIYTYMYKNDEPNFLRQTLCGILGPSTGTEIAKFAKEGSKGMFSPEEILNGTFTNPKDHAKWRHAVDNLMRWLETHGIKPTKDNLENISRFIGFGKKDAVNGLRRELAQSKYTLTDRLLGQLELQLDHDGHGVDFEDETEKGVVASDAKKTTTATPTAI